MICPNCKHKSIKVWPWYDGGYKGVQCGDCGKKWWSDSFSSAVELVQQKAMFQLIETSEFPNDAKEETREFYLKYG